ncbi:cytochrome P450 [Coprinellus micaceus]|uniref:Cytochrome P450 n=1 Tax=Coprinellus micaceus TaxID=71717 RepID=A0A4Y7RQL4_COPMI|nr:cytochrome P450 [Coprinellus micaceus]
MALTATVFGESRFLTTTVLVGISGIVTVLAYRKLKAKGRLPLPPGPPGLPIVGNIFDIPEEDFWWKYKEWSDQYGSDVIYLSVLGREIVVLNSLAACKELLEKRSAIYSSRPRMPMMNELIGFDWNIGFIPYDDAWKERRKMFSKAFSPNKIVQHRPALLKATRNLLLQLLDDPKNFREHIRLLSGSFILDITYGLNVTSKDDIYITQAERGMRGMAAAGTASSYLVDFIPGLQYLPSWLPGMRFKRDASEIRKDALAMAREPLTFVETALRMGNARSCIATEALEELGEGGEHYQEKRKIIHDVLGSTVSSITTFFLAMAQNPDIQARAQAVVDEALKGQGRLPDFTEFKKLPYIEALVREILRWRPVAPVGVPRIASQDDVYDSYRIPEGATVTEIRDGAPTGYDVFGFGRRVCPGSQSAVETIWAVVASVLSVFHIREGRGENLGKYTSGMLIHPYPFEVHITPRSEEAEMLLRNGVLEDHDFS